MSLYEDNRQMLIDRYLRASLLGIDRLRVDNFEYCVKGSDIIITRVYHYAKAKKIVIPEEFDILNATILRKSLIYLDLGNCKEATINLSANKNLEVFIARNLDLLERDWRYLLYGAEKLKYINVDRLYFVYNRYLEKSRETLIEGSFKSVILIDNNSFDGFKNLQIISLGKSLKAIHRDAFKGCINLKEVYFYGEKEDFDKVRIQEGNDYFKRARIHFIEERN